MKNNSKKFIFSAVILVIIIFSGIIYYSNIFNSNDSLPFKASDSTSDTAFLMDTLIEIQTYNGNEDFINYCFSRLEEIESKMSITDRESDIYKINNNPGQPVQVHQSTFYVIKTAKNIAELTGGKFDPSIGALTELWGIGSQNPRVPEEKEILEAKKNVNYKDIVLNENNYTVQIEENMSLDLGAIVKLGFSAKELRKFYNQTENIPAAFVSLGGDIVVFGEKPDGSSWHIGVQDPQLQKKRGELVFSLKFKGDKIITTSGNYERYFEENGKIYHHIFNPETGYPVRNNLKSVTLITEDPLMADAMATSLFIMGLETGIEFVKENLNNTKAVFITNDLEIMASPGLENKIELINHNFNLNYY